VSNPQPSCDVSSTAHVRNISDRLLHVLSARILVESKRRVRLVAEVSSADASRVRPYVEVGHYRHEKFTNHFDAFELDTARYIDDEDEVYVARAFCSA